VNVRPTDATCLDVSFYELVPGDVCICAIPPSKDAQVNDMLNACFPCCVNERFALRQHRDCVSGEQKHSIHAVKSCGERSGIIQINKDCITTLLL
jgi:hypothetical protein